LKYKRGVRLQLISHFATTKQTSNELIIICELPRYSMGRIMPPFRQLYQETVSELQTELKAALVDLGRKSAFDLLLKEAWNPQVAALGNSSLPTVCDKLNVMSTIHLRKLIATLVRENGQRDAVIDKLEERIGILEDKLNEIKPANPGLTTACTTPATAHNPHC
jgi:hypothetical protein